MSTLAREDAENTAPELRTADFRARRKKDDLLNFVRECRPVGNGWVVRWPMEDGWEAWRPDHAPWVVKMAAGTFAACVAAMGEK